MQQRLAAVGEMAAGIAHEIRNPLASMSGSIQILRQELPLSAEQEQLMDIVLRESERLNATIRSFLAYARPQRFHDRALRHPPRAQRHRAAAAQQRRGARAATRLTSICRPDLWYEADERQIKQVVWNLATNGLRADARRRSTAPLGTLRAATEGVVITVQDEGIGIPAEELDASVPAVPRHVSRRAAGSGWRSCIASCTDYSGEIQVSSQPGAGTTVAVRLPARCGGGGMNATGASRARAGHRSPAAAHSRRRR